MFGQSCVLMYKNLIVGFDSNGRIFKTSVNINGNLDNLLEASNHGSFLFSEREANQLLKTNKDLVIRKIKWVLDEA